MIATNDIMNLIDVLKLDIDSIEKEYEMIAAVLNKIGMSDYEAKAFVALVVRSHGTADDLSDLAGIPRTSTYKALRSLAKKGFVSSSDGRPTVFHVEPLLETKSRLISEIEDMFDKLEAVKGTLSDKGTPQLVYTLAGKKAVLAKIGEMLEASKRSFIISTPAIQEVRQELAPGFKDALKRGVQVTVVAEPMVKVPEASKVYRKRDLIATDVISDGVTAMIASPDLTLCGYSDNPFISSHLENFMRIVLEKLEGSQIETAKSATRAHQ
jgi:HTH-type transcriptional regulator, sugar sensing transcriptional regulator